MIKSQEDTLKGILTSIGENNPNFLPFFFQLRKKRKKKLCIILEEQEKNKQSSDELLHKL